MPDTSVTNLAQNVRCQHANLFFGSGTYYIFCHDCGERWGRLALGQIEFYELPDGTKVGTSPEAAWADTVKK